MMTVLEKLTVDTLRDLGEKDKHICGWSSSLSTVGSFGWGEILHS